MRKFINIVENAPLMEKWDKTLPSGEEIFRNPSASEFAKLMKQWGGSDYDAGLSFTRSGDILVFDASMTTHDDVLQHYDDEIDHDYPTALVTNLRGGYGIYLHHAYSFAPAYINGLVGDILNNQNIIRMLGADFPLVAETDDGDMVDLRQRPYEG